MANHLALQITNSQVAISVARDKVNSAVGALQVDSDSSEPDQARARGRSPSWDTVDWQDNLIQQEDQDAAEARRQMRARTPSLNPTRSKRRDTPAPRHPSNSADSRSSHETATSATIGVPQHTPVQTRSAMRAQSDQRSASRVRFEPPASPSSEGLCSPTQASAAAPTTPARASPAQPKTPDNTLRERAATATLQHLDAVEQAVAGASPQASKRGKGPAGRSLSRTRNGDNIPVSDTDLPRASPVRMSRTEQVLNPPSLLSTRSTSLGAFTTRRSVSELRRQNELDIEKRLKQPQAGAARGRQTTEQQ